MEFKDIFRKIRTKYIYKDSIDWKFLIALTEFVPDDKKVDFVIAFLRNPHTKIISISGAPGTIKLPTITHSGNNITIKYFEYLGGSLTDRYAYVNRIITALVSKPHYNTINIDLRENGGGDGHSMLLSLLPIFIPKRIIGYFYTEHTDDTFEPVEFKTLANGKVKFFGLTINKPKKVTADRINVLIGSGTGSSGEWMTVCLRAVGAIFKGKTTGIYNSVNMSFEISNDKMLLLTTGYFADHKKKIFDGPLVDTELNS